jgi:hypothetical protein
MRTHVVRDVAYTPLFFSDGMYVMLGGQHISEAYRRIRSEMLSKDPDAALEQRWKGGWGEILKWDTPVNVCRMASRLHNRRQHNSQQSTFYDLIRKMAQLASEVQMERAATREKQAIHNGTYVAGVSPPLPVQPAEAMLSPDDVYRAYLDSGYQDSTSNASAKVATGKPKKETVVVCRSL